MQHLILPISNDPAQAFVTEIDGSKYLFRVQYNTRQGTWTLDINTENDTPLSLGLPLVLGSDLLANNRVITGLLYVVDYSNTGVDPNIGDWGSRCDLVWSK